MPHVDEGTLHAYLDGELSASERAAVDSHLAQCATCRATLADARALLERASALLGTARPVERPAPPLEQLRRASMRSPWRVRTSVAWAASIVLALGIGYVLRNPTVARQVAPPVSVADQTSAPARLPPRDERRLAAPAARERSPAADVVVARPAPADKPAPSGSRTDSASTRKLQGSPLQLEEVVVTGQPAPAPSFASAAAKTVEREWPVISRSAARALLGAEAVGLPGLTVRTIRRAPGRDSTVLVEQALDSTTVIQFFQRPAGPPALSESSGYRYAEGAGRARTDHMLARFVGRLRVEIAGPVSVDSLNRLLEQVRPLP
jgi:putative zinc finger protein